MTPFVRYRLPRARLLRKYTRLLTNLILCVLLAGALEVNGQQCTLPSRIFLPTADETKIEQMGRSIDVDGNYMVAGLWENSNAQVSSGKVNVYKLNTDDHFWEKIAELQPSDPGKYRRFGYHVAISGNSIVVMGTEYATDGRSRGKLYVYEKSSTEEWTSSTESYFITKPFGEILHTTGYGKFELQGNELVALGYEGGKVYVEVYNKAGGVFLKAQAIEVPTPFSGYPYYEWNLVIGGDFIAISTEQFEHADRSSGAVFIYPKNITYSSTPVVLKALGQTVNNWMAFGINLAAVGSTLFVQGLAYDGVEYHRSFYVFERPLTGWQNDIAPALFQATSYVFSFSQLVATEEYLFSTGPGYQFVDVFKKPVGGWSSDAQHFSIDDLPADNSLIGYQIRLSGNHLVLGCPGRFSYDENIEELVADYYSPNNTWEAPDLQAHQIIREHSIDATADFFGEAFAVFNDQLAITASGDDVHGIDAGVVYVFDTQSESEEPIQKIYNPEEENFTGFGASMAMGDSVMFIGAPYKDSVDSDGTTKYYNIGKVYVYRQTAGGWQYSSQIVAPEIHSEINFGRTVVWSPGYCAVTEFYDGSSESVGRVHIYKENVVTGRFNYLATLDPATHLRADFFGQSMVMNDSLLVIGTGGIAPNTSYRMSVYVFRKKGEWQNATEDASLMSTDSGWSDRFGASVSMYGDYIVVGSYFSPGFDPRPIPRSYIIPGAAYIFKRPVSGWKGNLTEIAKLSPSDPVDFGTFGYSVAIDRDDIFIGSPNQFYQYNYTDKLSNNNSKLKPGKVYHFKKPAGEWVSTNQETRQILSFEPEVLDGYGANLFISDRYLYVGAMLDDTPKGFRTGSVQTLMQLPVIDTPPVLCQDSKPIKLLGFPKNGNWLGNGVHATTGVFSPGSAGAGLHTITYERSGCEATTTVEVLAVDLTIFNQSSREQMKCIGESIPIVFETDEAADQYEWYFKDLQDDTFLKIDSMKQRIEIVDPGYYQVIINRTICPTRIDTFFVMDEQRVPITIEPVPTVCDDSQLQLSADPSSGAWIGTGVSADGNFNPVSLPDGEYLEYYHVVTALGCRWNDSIRVTVDRLAQPQIQSSSQIVCRGMPVRLAVSNIDAQTTLTWHDGAGEELPGKTEPIVHISSAGEYYATAHKHTCSLNTSVVELVVPPDSLFVPNIVTGNFDTYNDEFEIHSEGIDDFYLILFNRYGKLVYETHDQNFHWNAASVPSGVYYWNVIYTTCADKQKKAKGWVQVLKE